MQPVHGAMLATLAFGFLGALGTTHPKFPTWLAYALMGLAGVLFYAGNHGWPHAATPDFQGWFAAVTDWLEASLLAAAAIPTAAQVFGQIPALKKMGGGPLTG